MQLLSLFKKQLKFYTLDFNKQQLEEIQAHLEI